MDNWVGDGNNIAFSQRQTMLRTRSKTKAAAVPVYPIFIEKTKNELKKQMNIMEDNYMPLSEVITHDNGKPVSLVSCPPVKNIKNNTKCIPAPCPTVKMNEMEKEFSVAPRYPPTEKANNMDFLYGLKFKDNGKAVVVGCNLVDLSKKYKEKEVATPINFGVLKKYKASSSCQLLLRTRSNRTQVEGAEDALQTKSLTDPLPNNKKRKCTSKVSSKEYVLPQNFIDQQRAYFREIDEYELEVEEVEQLSVYEE